MKKICFAFNHLQYSDGIARSAIGISNYLVRNYNLEITLRPIYAYHEEVRTIIDGRINVKPVFGFYFHGMSKIVSGLPNDFLHNLIYGKNKYDIEIGFQHGTSTKAVTFGNKGNSRRIIWMHGYDEGLTMLDYFKRADAVVCVSKYNANRLCKESGGIITPTYSYNLIDDKIIVSEGSEPINLNKNGKIVFVSVGRHSEEKGYKRLIHCAERLKRNGYSFELWLVGDGPDHQDLLELSDSLKMGDCIRFVGNQSNPHKYTSKADIFICSSYSEGYSTACTEAIMLGVPVLTTMVSGANEIIGEAEAGMVVENDDKSLYEGMKYILENSSVIDEWKRILSTTKERFSQEKRAERLISILQL